MILTHGSLFSGIGGIDLGLERTGHFKTIWHSEIDDYASRVLKKHWPRVKNLGDITIIDWDKVKAPDIISGGFPCQDISKAGSGDGLDGERSGLWKEMYRCICSLRPQYILVENVPSLTGKGIDRVLGDLAEGGYNAEWTILSAYAVGARHKRERIFIIAYPLRSRHVRGEPEIFPTQRGDDALSEFRTSCRWIAEPKLDRKSDGLSPKLDKDRIRCLGNAVVPQVAQFIGELIYDFHCRQKEDNNVN